MLLYLDASCFNRPFDDQTQPRILRESEAVLSVLERILYGADELAWSVALTFELSANPELRIRDELTSWAGRSEIDLTTAVLQPGRLHELVAQGFKPLDAAHVAFAEAGQCDVLLTCDDRLIRRAKRLGLSLRVMNPLDYLEEVSSAETTD